MSDYPWTFLLRIFFRCKIGWTIFLDSALLDTITTLEGEWAPPVDIYENDNEVVITAEIPGVNRKQININVDENILKIEGEKKLHTITKKKTYIDLNVHMESLNVYLISAIELIKITSQQIIVMESWRLFYLKTIWQNKER